MISAILLAGGLGTRMGSKIPKQFLLLGDKPLATYSFDVLCEHDLIDEVIVVCEKDYQTLFSHPKASFATPGKRRQDSVQSGLLAASQNSEYICIHDSARPFLKNEQITETIKAAIDIGAAAIGVPLKFTIKEVNNQGHVINTPNRNRYFEIQTPQIILKKLLIEGFETAKKLNLTVTDDVSLVELLEHPVKIVKGSYLNIKITTNEDMDLARNYVQVQTHNSI